VEKITLLTLNSLVVKNRFEVLNPLQKSAFTLLELIVVVMIVSLMSFMVFSTMSNTEEKKKEQLDPSTLPSTLRHTFQGKGDVELFCTNKCIDCYTLIDSEITAYEGLVKLGKDVEIYLLDQDEHLNKVDDFGRVKDQKVCLRYHLYANGSTTKMVISNSKGVYYLPSFFGKAKEVKDMEEAKSLWIKEDYRLDDSGSFY